ncbi:hypothetical protein RJ40_01455 [Methanofollis aquaemaris]|uniref:Proline dehydrogenase domain-containing protein n=2 Tax=Methanofollis aquaemaris TaxID=126734 RepID=A0A8A3S192_9EURY|nr:hypothetical protein RJ40_01455 [Methanofollis aquaemaris]
MRLAMERWHLPGLKQAVERCRERNGQGITCTLTPISEFAKDKIEAKKWASEFVSAVRAAEKRKLDAAVGVKLTALGGVFDPEGALEHLDTIVGDGERRGVAIELDMEGRGLVDLAMEAAYRHATAEPPLTLAVQAYLDRTVDDLSRLAVTGTRPRLVKGAYLGDADDFFDVQARFRSVAARLITSGRPFSIGTHDPDLVAWLLDAGGASKEQVEFAFLTGLADRTKEQMAGQGWRVREYIPFGEAAGAYVERRRRYLANLRALGRMPLP